MDDAQIRRELDRVDGRLRTLEAVPMTLATHGTEIAMMKDDLTKLENKLDSGFEKMHDRISALAKEFRDARAEDVKLQQENRDTERDERKRDKLAFAGLFIAGMGSAAAVGALVVSAGGL